MAISITSILNGTEPKKEWVYLSVTEDDNLHRYAIVDRTFMGKEMLSNEFRHIFVFPNTVVKKGDIVRLCSGTNAQRYVAKKTEDGKNTIHIFYWGSGDCVWNNNGKDIATLIRWERIHGWRV